MSLHPAPHHHFDPSPPEATISPRRRAGVNILNASYTTDLRRRIDQLAVNRVRITLLWDSWSDPTYQAAWAAIMTDLRGAGYHVTNVVHTPPAALATLADGIAAMPAFVAARAADWPGCAWQILNEANGNDAETGGWFQASNPSVTPAQRGTWYGELLAPVYDAVHAADATAQVVSCGMTIDETTFVSNMLTAASNKVDAVGAECYGDPLWLPPGSLPHQGQYVLYSQRLRPICGAIPIWCTETGYNAADDVTQATQLGNILRENDQNTRWDQTYLYAWVSGADNFGIAHADGTYRHAALLLTDRSNP